MTGETRRSSRDRWPLGLLGMLALVVLIERTVDHHALDFNMPGSWEWRASGRAATAEAIRSRVLCFGDSLAKMAIVPKVLEERLGKSAYNLAVCNGRAASSYFLLRRALEAGADPDVILVDFKWTALASDSREDRPGWPELLNARESLDLAWTARDADLLVEITTARLLPTFRARFELRDNVKAALAGRSASQSAWVLAGLRNWRVNKGATLNTPNPPFQGGVDLGNKKLFPDRWACDPVNRRYVERFLALAGSRGIRVVWLIPPISPAAQAQREQIGADRAYTRFIGAMQVRFPGVVVVDARRAGFETPMFADPTHLNARGACALSGEVADLLDRDLALASAGAPWVALGVVRDRPFDVPLEDLAQSRLAVDRRFQARR